MQEICANSSRIQRFRLRQLHQAHPPVYFYNQCCRLFDLAKKIQAAKRAHRVLAIFPKYEKLWLFYFDILFWYASPHEYLEEALKAYTRTPHFSVFVFELGRAYLYCGDAEAAAKLLRNSFYLSVTKFPMSRIYLARAEYLSGNCQAAVDIYKQTAIDHPVFFQQIFRDLVSYAPEAPEILEFEKKILQTMHDEKIYSVLLFNAILCFGNGHAVLVRQRLLRMIDVLSAKKIPLAQIRENYSYMAFEQPHLGDQGINDRILRKKLADLYICCSPDISSHSITSFDLKEKTRLKLGIAINGSQGVGFISNFFALFEHFDTNKFELVFFAQKNMIQDECYDKLCSLFSKVIVYDAVDSQEYKKLLLHERLDIYMGENVKHTTLTLAFFSRFAPVQINAWDRCDSFGAPHTDYALIFGEKNNIPEWSQSIEGKYALISQQYNTHVPDTANIPKVDYPALGLPQAPFFFFSQALSRILPQDDHIFVTLLQNNPDFYFLFPAISPRTLFIFYRWKKLMPNCMERIRFFSFPPKAPPVYLGLLLDASVLLGPISAAHGGVSSSTAFALGLPLVAGYGSCWNSCITRFQYMKMGVKGLIASSSEEYIAIVQRLIDDPEWKAQKSAEIKKNFQKLSNMATAAQEIQDFLMQAYERARLSLKPQHWEHGYFIENETKAKF